MSENTRETIIKEEIESQLEPGKGCIIFDFGCFFPYSNPEDLIFDFQLGEETFNDIKKNHRYPNKLYYTLSKKTGRSISKIGYPYFFDLKKEKKPQIMHLHVKFGMEDDIKNITFPLQINITPERPFYSLEFRLSMKDNTFTVETHESINNESGQWYPIIWMNDEKMYAELWEEHPRMTLLQKPEKISENTFMYKEIINLPAETIDTVFMNY